jgi:small subunit ribosomal protein S6
MREYEVTIIVQPQLDDEIRDQVIERVSGWLTSGREETDKPVIHRWGQRRLAYPIKKFSEGYYVLYEAKVNPDRMKDIERNIQFTEDILRYLVVRKS